MESNNNIRFSPPHAQPAAPEDSFREPLQDDASHEEWHDEGELDDGLNPYFQNLSRAAYEGFQAPWECSRTISIASMARIWMTNRQSNGGMTARCSSSLRFSCSWGKRCLTLKKMKGKR